MAVLVLKPYEYKVYYQEGTTVDGNGHPHASAKPEWSSERYECDFVKSDGRANEITLDDGSKVQYGHTIYGKTKSPVLITGQKIEVYRKGKTTPFFTGEIKGFNKLQLSTKIWV